MRPIGLCQQQFCLSPNSRLSPCHAKTLFRFLSRFIAFVIAETKDEKINRPERIMPRKPCQNTRTHPYKLEVRGMLKPATIVQVVTQLLQGQQGE